MFVTIGDCLQKHLPTDELGSFTDDDNEYMDTENFISSPLSNYKFDEGKYFCDDLHT